MDAVSSLTPTSISLTPNAINPATPDAFSSLDSEQFVKIMFTELSKQDPEQPSDSNALLQQISSLRNIQSDIDLSNKLSSLVAQNELSAASGLIGKTVSGITDNAQRVQGVVTKVLRDSNGAVLSLADGNQIHMSNLDQVLGTTGSPGTTP